MLAWPGSFPAPSQAPALCRSFRGRARCALTLRPPCSTAFHRRGLEVPSGASASARRFWPQERTHRNPRGKGVRGRPLAAGREGAHPGSGRSEDAAGPCLARTRCERYERGFKTGAANAPFSPASPTTAGDATSVPSASRWSAGGRGAGAGRPRGQVSTREWAAWSQREFPLLTRFLPSGTGAAGRTRRGLYDLRPSPHQAAGA